MIHITEFLNIINTPLTFILVIVLCFSGIWFTILTKGVQFRMIGEMVRIMIKSPEGNDKQRKSISGFQAFSMSLATRVGTGNMAGVATAICLGGPGAVFWMWIMALIGSVNTFIECTLAQIFKSKDRKSYIGGPAYYITKGLGKRWLACIFSIAIIGGFGLANNMVQANTITAAFSTAFNINPIIITAIITLTTLTVIFGGVQRIAKVCTMMVPFMAIAYLMLALYVIASNITIMPDVISIIIKNAFGMEEVAGGSVGMAIRMGFTRGIFSNEAGEGSAPNAAATAEVTHPVKQGLLQTLGVFTDTLIVCSCTAFIILCSGIYDNGLNGIELTQVALCSQIGEAGKSIVAIAILFFAFSSIIGNYYYGENNILFLLQGKQCKSAVILSYRLLLGLLLVTGSLTTIDLVWASADFFMVIMTVTNLVSILLLGRYAVRLLYDYQQQREEGIDPKFTKDKLPEEIQEQIECW